MTTSETTPDSTFRVVKSLNSSVVLSVDAAGHEWVLLGKGIGYGRRPGDVIDPNTADQAFVPVSRISTGDPLQTLSFLTPERLGITEEIIDLAETRLGTRLNRYLLVALTDHLAFVLDRAQSNTSASLALWWDVQDIYPEEYAVATEALAIVERHTGISLRADEAVSIMLHLVNAEQSSPGMPNIAKLSSFLSWLAFFIDEINPAADPKSRSRLMRHGRSFFQRLLADDMLDGDVAELVAAQRHREPQVMALVDELSAHIAQLHSRDLANEEQLHFALYLKPILQELQ